MTSVSSKDEASKDLHDALSYGIIGNMKEVPDQSAVLDISLLKALEKMPVDVFHGKYLEETKNEALILCVDIRNFSTFLRENDEGAVFNLIKIFTSNFLSCVNQLGKSCSYYKLEGDGAIVIWDESPNSHVNEAVDVFYEFNDFLKTDLFLNSASLGFAGALVLDKVFKYEISAEVAGLMYRDYVGYGINLACRLQTLAVKDELIISHKLIRDRKLPSTKMDMAKIADQVSVLKGLRDEDRKQVYLYDRNPGT